MTEEQERHLDALRVIHGRLLAIWDGMSGSNAMHLRDEIGQLERLIRELENRPRPLKKALPANYRRTNADGETRRGKIG